MIEYKLSCFGINTLLQVRGSAIYKAALPSLLSTAFLIAYSFAFFWDDHQNDPNNFDFGRANNGMVAKHPYVIGAYMTFVSFFVVSRLNFSYQRYWEGATAIHAMSSKWLDALICMAAFHYQSNIMKPYQPPSFGDVASGKSGSSKDRQQQKSGKKQEATSTSQAQRRRSRGIIDRAQSIKQVQEDIILLDQQQNNNTNKSSTLRKRRTSSSTKSGNNNNNNTNNHQTNKDDKKNKGLQCQEFQNQFLLKKSVNSSGNSSAPSSPATPNTVESIEEEEQQQEGKKIANQHFFAANDEQKNHQQLGSSSSSTTTNNNNKHIPSPSLFLQEIVHLFSLLSAVALSTLRNDIEGAPAPLVEYFPGQPMAPVNSDEYFNIAYFRNLSNYTRQTTNYYAGTRRTSVDPGFRASYNSHRSHQKQTSKILRAIYFTLGLSRTNKQRTLYNAARPFQVLGGVSDGEIAKLQQAHGPYAKMSLCTMWLQEFITREHMAGSTGKVAFPIISRVYQFISDGNKGYNTARQNAYVPFPFPHAQIATFFIVVTFVLIMPLIFVAWVNSLPYACVMNFVTVLCFVGLNEVARELENPMHNVPNDLPLLHFQSEFNEALITVYAGYHPDSWWIVEEEEEDDDKDGVATAAHPGHVVATTSASINKEVKEASKLKEADDDGKVDMA